MNTARGSASTEFRCRFCGWEDTNPEKCTRCGSLRELPLHEHTIEPGDEWFAYVEDCDGC